jgi:hypothetical protein
MGTLQIRVLTDLITDLEVVGPEMAVVLAELPQTGKEAVVPEAMQATAVTLIAMPATVAEALVA